MDTSATLKSQTSPSESKTRTGISNGRLGFMLLIGTEAVLFSSFIGAFLVLRGASPSWPPVVAPRLEWGLSSFNTVLLMASSAYIAWARGMRARMGVLSVFCAGIAFIGLQMLEFEKHFGRGLTLQTGAYGALFYSLIVCHLLHVVGGLVVLATTFRKLFRQRADAHAWRGHAELYWHFVTGVWLVLFGILYVI